MMRGFGRSAVNVDFEATSAMSAGSLAVGADHLVRRGSGWRPDMNVTEKGSSVLTLSQTGGFFAGT